MYKRAGRFHAAHGRKITGRHNLTMYDRLGEKMQFGFRPAVIQRLEAEVRDVTPSLRKRSTIDERAILAASKRQKRARETEGRRVYLVLFTLRSNPAVRFIKVGISRLDLMARFQRELGNYEIKIIAETERARNADAVALEAAFHAAFSALRHSPCVRLASGNTECYQHTEQNLRRMREIIEGL